MAENRKIEIAYKTVRGLIFLIPAITVLVAMYLILFPVENFGYFSNNPGISKLEPEKDPGQNEIAFGVFPIQKHRFADLNINFKKGGDSSCFAEKPEIRIRKTYRAFLFPEGDPVRNEEELRNLIFFENNTKYPNGSLLHLKPTDEVYLISDGKKILFPGPEIFRAFGYDFANLTDVDKSALDQFPDAEKKVFLWTQPHPNGTIFLAFPSHKSYLIHDGQKHRIENPDSLKNIWADSFSIAAQDEDSQKPFDCGVDPRNLPKRKTSCQFDTFAIPESIGRYYFFTIGFSDKCDVSDLEIETAEISFRAEKSYSSMKDSLRVIFASILNRYIYKQSI